MANLPSSFIITLDDGAISYNVESHEKKIHAQVGGGNPAIFTYDHKKRLLQSGNYYFGQHLDPREPSGPQCVYWIQKDAGIPEDAIQKTTIEESNGRYRIKNGDAPLSIIHGRVAADSFQPMGAPTNILKA